MPDPATGYVEVATRSGFTVRLRQARHQDDRALVVGFTHLSEESRYARFFTAVPRLAGSLLESLTNVDGHSRIAIAAFDPARESEVGEPDGYGIAVARWIQADDGSPTAELAIAIIDEYQHLGLGHVLLTALEVVAEARGIERLEAVVLASNLGMTRLLLRHGAHEVHATHPDPGIRVFALDIRAPLLGPGDDALRDALRPLATASHGQPLP